jgi:predicted dehydrogenase
MTARPSTPRETPLGVLLVGGGRTHQEDYAQAFAADGRARLVGVADEEGVSADRARWNRELAGALGVPLLPSLEAALERPDVHIASVCVEKERRGRVGAVCARAGKHVYMDKPLAGSLEDAADLVAAVRERGVKSQMFSLVRTPWAERARGLVRSGALGDLLALDCDLLFAKGPAGTAPGTPRKESYPPRRFTFVDSKRELFTTGVYSLGLLRWLSGREVRRVFATTQNYFFAEHARNGVEDFGAAVIELEGGIAASITAGRIGWTSHPAGGPMRLRLTGTRASAVVDAYRPRIEVSSDALPWTPPSRSPEDPMGFWSSTRRASGERPKEAWVLSSAADVHADARHFLDSIAEDRESDLDAAAGKAILEALFACYRSAATGGVVDL